ncbi:MAG: heme exporter protein CcmB [Polyangiales bacterium]
MSVSLLRQTLTIAARELRVELRAREIVPTMTLFAALVAVLSSMSLFVDDETGRRVAPGVLWIAVAFAGTLGLSRSWGREREEGALRGVMLTPTSPAAIFLGKALGSLAFLAATEVVVTPLVALLLHAPVGDHLGAVTALLALGSVGFVLAGTLFGAMIARTRARTSSSRWCSIPWCRPRSCAAWWRRATCSAARPSRRWPTGSRCSRSSTWCSSQGERCCSARSSRSRETVRTARNARSSPRVLFAHRSPAVDPLAAGYGWIEKLPG